MEAMYFAKRNVMFNDLNSGSLKTTPSTQTPNKPTQTVMTASSKQNHLSQRAAAGVVSSKTKTSQLIQNHLAKQNNQPINTDTIFKQTLNDNQMKSTSLNMYNSNNSNILSSNKRFLNRPVTPSNFYNKINKSSKENVNTSTETINIINKNSNKKPTNTNNQIITHLLNSSLVNDNSYMTFNNKSEISLEINQNSINHFNHTPPKIKNDDLKIKNMQNTFIQINRLTENHIKLKEQILNHYLSNNSNLNQNKQIDELANNNLKNNSINNPANFESRSTLMDYHSKLRLANNNSNNSSYNKFVSNTINKPKSSTNNLSKKLSPKLKLNNKEYSFHLKSMHNNNSANQTSQFFNQFMNKTTNSENQFRRSSLEISLDEKNRSSAVNNKFNSQINEKQSISIDPVKNTNINGDINNNFVESRASNRNVNNKNALVINYLSNKLINNRTSPKTQLKLATSNNTQQKNISTTPSNQQVIDKPKEIQVQETNNIQAKECINDIDNYDNDGEDKIEYEINQANNNNYLQMTLDREELLLLEQINKKCNEWLDKHVMPFIYINTSSSVSIDSSSSFEDESKYFR